MLPPYQDGGSEGPVRSACGAADSLRGQRAAGCEYLHVDFENHLKPFYLETCGFSPAPAELLRLK